MFHRVLDARNHDSPADVWAFVVQVIVAHRGDRSDQVIVFGVCGVGGKSGLNHRFKDAVNFVADVRFVY